jgi:2-haloacid dehalogenase
VYAALVEECKRRGASSASEIWFVAAHAWDIAGAKNSGLGTIFVEQEEKVYPHGCFPEPDIIASDVSEGVDKMLAASNGH